MVNGVQLTWNPVSNQWLPENEVNEDFLAAYQLNYGVEYDYESMKKPEPEKSEEQEKKVDDEDEEKTKKRPPGAPAG